MAHLMFALEKNIFISLNLNYSYNIHLNIFIIVSSSEAVSNVSPTEIMNQDTSMLSKQTTLTEEYTQREKGN